MAKASKTPKKSKSSISRPKSKARRRHKHPVLNIIKWMFIIMLVAGIGLGAVTVISVGNIDTKNIYEQIEQTSYLYDSTGVQIDSLHYYEDRKIVSIDEMPENLKNAFIAIEDKTFYKHHGFNFRRMFGAVLSSITRKTQISGTSTITQQLARNAYLSDIKSQRSIRRKLSEMYIAWRLEHSLTKDQILEAYLNTIYLGYGNYGVNGAARTYFSKDVSELSLPECAALAALPQAPDTYALIQNDKGEDGVKIPDTDVYANDVSKDRRDLVLSLMTEQGFITKKQAKKANVDIIDILNPTFESNDSTYSYFTDYVAEAVTNDLMEEYSLTEDEARRMVYTGGLKINTTLSSTVQDIIVTEFENEYNFPSAIDGSEVQASMVITEVGTGHITAMVGGRNTTGSKLFNRCLSPRQPGSSIKPLSVYGAALQKSADCAAKKEPFPFVDYDIDNQGVERWGDYITAGSVVVDEPLTFNNEIWPQNVTRYFSGWNTFRTALQQSINTCAVKILLQVGTDYSIDMLEKFGITTVVSDTNESVNDVNPAALALGAMTYGVTPLEMSLAYAAFPNDGYRNTPVCYTQVFDRNGKTILYGESESIKVMDSNVAWVMTDLLKSVVSQGIAGNAYIWGTEVGGKTGTTNDRYDVWFDGFTPKYSGALWIGTDLNVEMTSGSWMASSLWAKIMKQIPDITEGEYSEQPEDVVRQYGEYYTSGTEPYSISDDWYYDDSEDEDTDEDLDIESSTDTGTGDRDNQTTEDQNNGDNNGNTGDNTGQNGDTSGGGTGGDGTGGTATDDTGGQTGDTTGGDTGGTGEDPGGGTGAEGAD